MKIIGFDNSFLKEELPEEGKITSEAFLEKVMIPSDYFEVTAAVATIVSESRPNDCPVCIFCDIIRRCKTNADYLAYMRDVPNKDSEDYKELERILNGPQIDQAISFATLIAQMRNYSMLDEKTFKFLSWVLLTGSYDYLKVFARYCEDTNRHSTAMALLATLFRECKIIAPHLYNYADDVDLDDIEEIYPELYEYMEDEDYTEDYDGTLTVDDFITFMNWKRTQNNADAILVYNDVIDLIYDIFDDGDTQYSTEYFLMNLTSVALVKIHEEWKNTVKALAAENLICEFISSFEGE